MDGITDAIDMSLSRLQELVIDREPSELQSMGSQRVGPDWATELNETKMNPMGLQGTKHFLCPLFSEFPKADSKVANQGREGMWR